jgi:protocatechuate 3,4-dioxygenase beta subunit
VLVRLADAVRRRESAGSWLHGVALRVAAHARASLARRRRHERCAGELAATADRYGAVGVSPELAAVLHEELGRLPERYRAALVLCYLEGHTCESAARRLGWPVGTVKSRLARGRERLRGRLIRRGEVPNNASKRSTEIPIGGESCTATTGSAPACGPIPAERPMSDCLDNLSDSPPATALVIPAALAHSTVAAMLRFAAVRPIAGAVSAEALALTLQTLRTMQMTQFATISALLISGLAATGAAMIIAQEREPAQTQSAAPTKTVAQEHKTTGPDERVKDGVFSVRVIDTRGGGVPNVNIKVVEEYSVPADHASRTAAYRAGAGGRAHIAVDRRFNNLSFEARPDDRTIGWASLRSYRWPLSPPTLPKVSDDNPITLTLLPRNHQVEGTIVDVRGKPIRGVQVRAFQFNHEANGFATDHRIANEEPALGAAITDDAGRYRLSLPQDTAVSFTAYHAKFVGPIFSCSPEDRTIPQVRLEDAGGIAGKVIDAATGEPVAGAQVSAGCIETTDFTPRGGSGSVISDAQGHFVVGGLRPGVCILRLEASPKGRKFTARAVEGIRVKAGEDAKADLHLIAGRRLHGTAVDAGTGKPLPGLYILCYNASGACAGTFTDEHGGFDYFVPPGPAFVYINVSGVGPTVNVPENQDPDPVVLKQGYDPNAKQPPEPRLAVECEVRVRVKSDDGDRPAQKEDRSLTGRVFDQRGTPLVAVQVHFNNNRTPNMVATDRVGIFRMNGLPHGPLGLGLSWNMPSDDHGWAHIPADAAEVDLIYPR